MDEQTAALNNINNVLSNYIRNQWFCGMYFKTEFHFQNIVCIYILFYDVISWDKYLTFLVCKNFVVFYINCYFMMF